MEGEEVALCQEIERDLLERGLTYGGLEGDLPWQICPEPFLMGLNLVKEIEALGEPLYQFLSATGKLYQRFPWVRKHPNRGKSPKVLELQNRELDRGKTPMTFCPNLILTSEGLKMVELQTQTKGMGVTDTEEQVYLDWGLIGQGQRVGRGIAYEYAALLKHLEDEPDLAVLAAKDNRGYLDEFATLSRTLSSQFDIRARTGLVEEEPLDTGNLIHRIFELYLLEEKLPWVDRVTNWVKSGSPFIFSPVAPFFEEKALMALLFEKRLRRFWQKTLGDKFYLRLLSLFVETTIVDKKNKEISWGTLLRSRPSTRPYVLKISGYSPACFGGRGVYLGPQESNRRWQVALSMALEQQDTSWVLQRWYESLKIPIRSWDKAAYTIIEEERYLRILPYFIVVDKQARLSAIEVNARHHPKVHLGRDCTSQVVAIET